MEAIGDLLDAATALDGVGSCGRIVRGLAYRHPFERWTARLKITQQSLTSQLTVEVLHGLQPPNHTD